MHFDKQARDWDNDPKKTERAVIIAKEIMEFIPTNNRMNALEFGCGTGLLSFQLKDFFKTITLADNSDGMITVLKEKIVKAGIENFKPIQIDSLESDLAQNDFDVIYTLMTLHHVLDVKNIAKEFNSKMKSGGFLCIADLVAEDGSFHSEHPDFNGHNGFDKIKLSKILSNSGFKVEYYKICLEIVKEFEDKTKSYPLFLMICKKN
ncbi:MAG: hypothetical protein A2033_16490 [Bacteroidetes bacterium GWA2_31_9]|nr:MAG: hypothetical protein A2033_16490 [Bacteroidetes bacterium GWA2_31_9]